LDEDKDAPGIQTQLKHTIETEEKDEEEGGIFHHYIDFSCRLSHVHVNDDSQIVKHRYETGQNPDDD
jgi:hypothetical protein